MSAIFAQLSNGYYDTSRRRAETLKNSSYV